MKYNQVWFSSNEREGKCKSKSAMIYVVNLYPLDRMRPKLRAGARINDDAASPYARTDILSQPDLHPTQGYMFPPRARPKMTNSYKVSEDSPFQSWHKTSMVPESEEHKVLEESLPELIRTEQLCTRAAKAAISTGTNGELRPLHSQIVQDAVVKERKQQILMKEKVTLARMKDEAHWADVERAEGESTQKWLTTDDGRKRRNQQALAETYLNEIALLKKRQEAEAQRDREEAAELQRLERLEAEKEKKRQEQQRKINEERRKEFQQRNNELLMRRANRLEADDAEERRIAKEHEEVERRMAEREEKTRKAREERNRNRERMIDAQSKRLADLKAKEQNSNQIAESELAKRDEARRKADLERREQMKQERHQDWLESRRIKELRMAQKTVEEEPVDKSAEEAEEFERLMRRKKEQRLRDVQKMQMAEQRARAKREEEEMYAPGDQFFLKENEWW